MTAYRTIPSIEQILENIVMLHDQDLLYFKEHRYEKALESTFSNLVFWLYQRLHTGSFIDSNQIIENVKEEEFRNEIIKATKDLGEKVTVMAYSSFANSVDKLISSFDTTSGVILEGIRVSSKLSIDKDKKDVISIRVPSLRPYLSPGFVMYRADSNYRHVSYRDEETKNQKRRRWYVECNDSSFALSFWSALLPQLQDLDIPFSAKILSNKNSYPRNDAIVVYTFDSTHFYDTIKKILLDVNRSRVEKPIISESMLIEYVDTGIGTAEQPMKFFSNRERSFGEHRCEAIAYAVRDSLLSYIPLDKLLLSRFKQFNIDPNNISCNLLT